MIKIMAVFITMTMVLMANYATASEAKFDLCNFIRGEKKVGDYLITHGKWEIGEKALTMCYSSDEVAPNFLGSLKSRLLSEGMFVERQYSYSTLCFGIAHLFKYIYNSNNPKEGIDRLILMLSDTGDITTANMAAFLAMTIPTWNTTSITWLLVDAGGEGGRGILKVMGGKPFWTDLKRQFFRALLENRAEDAHKLMYSARIDHALGLFHIYCGDGNSTR